MCGEKWKNYVNLGLGDAYWNTRHNSDKVGGKEVVGGIMNLKNMENSKIHKLLIRITNEFEEKHPLAHEDLNEIIYRKEVQKDVKELKQHYLESFVKTGCLIQNCI